MSFSPLSLFLSLAITGPAFMSFVVAPDRHYPIFSASRGSLFWIDESGSMTAFSNEQEPDICSRSRSRSTEIDIREQQVFPKQVSKRSLPGANGGSKAHYQLAMTIMLPLVPEPLKYDRKWTGSCGISDSDEMINVWPLDARMPFDAIPVSHNSDQEVSACLKINREGDVIDFKFARPGGKTSKSIAQKIEKVARKCWVFDNLTDQTGWIQVGLDRREKVTPL